MIILITNFTKIRTLLKQLNILLTVLFTLTIFSQLQAAGELRRPFQGIRNLGMGNVGVAMSHDENALFYNPAGLAAVDTTLVNIPFQAEFSNDAQTLVSEASGLAGKSTSEILTSYLGKEVHLRIMFPNLSVVIPFGFMTFGVVGGTETTIDFSVSNPASIQMDFGMRLDQIYNAGLGFSLARGKWLVGFNVEQYSRCDVPIATVSQATLLAGGNFGDTVGTCTAAKLRKGTTYGFGFQQRMTSFSTLRLTWGFAARNVGSLKFSRESGETNPVDQKPEYSLGISSMLFDSFVFRNFYEIDYRDITYDHVEDPYCNANKNSSDCNMKRLHFGTEFGFWPIDSTASAVAIRLGWNQGYVSKGLEWNPFIFFKAATIQYAEYKAETGNAAGDKTELRKVIQFNLGF